MALDRLSPPPLLNPSIVVTGASDGSSPGTPNHQHTAFNLESNQASVPYREHLRWRKLLLGRSKLKASSRTSALLSGFAIIALVETQIGTGNASNDEIPGHLLVLFSICTTILIAVHLFALLISTCILPNLEVEMEDRSYPVHQKHITYYVDMAWICSTGIGIMLFLVEIALVSWIKFWPFNFWAAISATIIVVPLMFIFMCFGMKFYWQLAAVHTDNVQRDLFNLDNVAKNLPKSNSVMSANGATPFEATVVISA